MGITYEELKKLKGNSTVLERQENIQIEQTSNNYIRRKHTIIRESFPKRLYEENKKKVAESKERVEKYANEKESKNITKALIQSLILEKEEHEKFELKLNITTQHLNNLEKVIQHEIKDLKQEHRLLKMSMNPKTKNFGIQNEDITWAENLKANSYKAATKVGEEVTVEKFFPQYQGVSISPDDVPVRPKMRTIASQMETSKFADDSGAFGDYSSLNGLYLKQKYDKDIAGKVKDSLPNKSASKDLIVNCCHCMHYGVAANPVGQHYNIVSNCNGVVCNQNKYQEFGVTPQREYNYCRDEYYYDYPNSPQILFNCINTRSNNIGRHFTDLNTQHFYCHTKDKLTSPKIRSTFNSNRNDDPIKKHETTLKAKDRKPKETYEAYALRKQRECQDKKEKAKERARSKDRSNKKVKSKSMISKQEQRNLYKKIQNKSISKLVEHLDLHTPNYSLDSPESQYSLETLRMLRKMKIKEYKALQPSHLREEKLKSSSTEAKKSLKEQNNNIKKYKEYINNYRKEEGEDTTKTLSEQLTNNLNEQHTLEEEQLQSAKQKTLTNQAQLSKSETLENLSQTSKDQPQINRNRPQIQTLKGQTKLLKLHTSENPPQTARDQLQNCRNRSQTKDTQLLRNPPQTSRDELQTMELQSQTTDFSEQPQISKNIPQTSRKQIETSQQQHQISRDLLQTSRGKSQLSSPHSFKNFREQTQISSYDLETSTDEVSTCSNTLRTSKQQPQVVKDQQHSLKHQPQQDSRDAVQLPIQQSFRESISETQCLSKHLQANTDKTLTSRDQPKIHGDEPPTSTNPSETFRDQSPTVRDQINAKDIEVIDSYVEDRYEYGPAAGAGWDDYDKNTPKNSDTYTKLGREKYEAGYKSKFRDVAENLKYDSTRDGGCSSEEERDFKYTAEYKRNHDISDSVRARDYDNRSKEYQHGVEHFGYRSKYYSAGMEESNNIDKREFNEDKRYYDVRTREPRSEKDRNVDLIRHQKHHFKDDREYHNANRSKASASQKNYHNKVELYPFTSNSAEIRRPLDTNNMDYNSRRQREYSTEEERYYETRAREPGHKEDTRVDLGRQIKYRSECDKDYDESIELRHKDERGFRDRNNINYSQTTVVLRKERGYDNTTEKERYYETRARRPGHKEDTPVDLGRQIKYISECDKDYNVSIELRHKDERGFRDQNNIDYSQTTVVLRKSSRYQQAKGYDDTNKTERYQYRSECAEGLLNSDNTDYNSSRKRVYQTGDKLKTRLEKQKNVDLEKQGEYMAEGDRDYDEAIEPRKKYERENKDLKHKHYIQTTDVLKTGSKYQEARDYDKTRYPYEFQKSYHMEFSGIKDAKHNEDNNFEPKGNKEYNSEVYKDYGSSEYNERSKKIKDHKQQIAKVNTNYDGINCKKNRKDYHYQKLPSFPKYVKEVKQEQGKKEEKHNRLQYEKERPVFSDKPDPTINNIKFKEQCRIFGNKALQYQKSSLEHDRSLESLKREYEESDESELKSKFSYYVFEQAMDLNFNYQTDAPTQKSFRNFTKNENSPKEERGEENDEVVCFRYKQKLEDKYIQKQDGAKFTNFKKELTTDETFEWPQKRTNKEEALIFLQQVNEQASSETFAKYQDSAKAEQDLKNKLNLPTLILEDKYTQKEDSSVVTQTKKEIITSDNYTESQPLKKILKDSLDEISGETQRNAQSTSNVNQLEIKQLMEKEVITTPKPKLKSIKGKYSISAEDQGLEKKSKDTLDEKTEVFQQSMIKANPRDIKQSCIEETPVKTCSTSPINKETEYKEEKSPENQNSTQSKQNDKSLMVMDETNSQNSINSNDIKKKETYLQKHINDGKLETLSNSKEKLPLETLLNKGAQAITHQESYYYENPTEPHYLESKKDCERYLEYQENMSCFPPPNEYINPQQSPYTVEYTASQDSKQSQYYNPNQCYETKYAPLTYENEYYCSPAGSSISRISQKSGGITENNKTSARFTKELTCEVAALPLKSILNPYLANEVTSETLCELETYRTTSSLSFGQEKQITMKREAVRTHTLEHEKMAQLSDENIGLRILRKQTKNIHSETTVKPSICKDINQIIYKDQHTWRQTNVGPKYSVSIDRHSEQNPPPFTNCPCMMNIYLDMLEIYYKSKNKYNFNKTVLKRSTKN